MEFEHSLKLPLLFKICEPVVFKAGKVAVIIVYLVKTTGFKLNRSFRVQYAPNGQIQKCRVLVPFLFVR